MPSPLQPPNLILVSESPRRAELLKNAGYRFRIERPRHDEQHGGDARRPDDLAEARAFYKASSLADQFPNATLLGADTVCAMGNDLIGKPADRDHARQILTRLSGTQHRVVTALALLTAGGDRRLIAHDVTEIVCRPLSPDWIERYLDSGQWQGKAGAYGLQERGDEFVERIEGSFSNVVGLPLELLNRMLTCWCTAGRPARRVPVQ